MDICAKKSSQLKVFFTCEKITTREKFVCANCNNILGILFVLFAPLRQLCCIAYALRVFCATFRHLLLCAYKYNYICRIIASRLKSIEIVSTFSVRLNRLRRLIKIGKQRVKQNEATKPSASPLTTFFGRLLIGSPRCCEIAKNKQMPTLISETGAS